MSFLSSNATWRPALARWKAVLLPSEPDPITTISVASIICVPFAVPVALATFAFAHQCPRASRASRRLAARDSGKAIPTASKVPGPLPRTTRRPAQRVAPLNASPRTMRRSPPHATPCVREYKLGAGGRHSASAPSAARKISTFNG